MRNPWFSTVVFLIFHTIWGRFRKWSWISWLFFVISCSGPGCNTGYSFKTESWILYQDFLDLCPCTAEIRFSWLRSNENRDFPSWIINGVLVTLAFKWPFNMSCVNVLSPASLPYRSNKRTGYLIRPGSYLVKISKNEGKKSKN